MTLTLKYMQTKYCVMFLITPFSTFRQYITMPNTVKHMTLPWMYKENNAAGAEYFCRLAAQRCNLTSCIKTKLLRLLSLRKEAAL